jgi:fermentation-respiration switch protein FrsA (DUF1100 family)
MAIDWAAAAAAATRIIDTAHYPLGYFGASMGTRLGVTTVATMPAIRAAVFAVGGLPAPGGTAAVLKAYGTPADEANEIERLTPVDIRGEELSAEAARLSDQDVLMINAVDDMLHPVDYAMKLYRAFATPRKRIAFFPGNHGDLTVEALQYAAWWLRRRLEGVSSDDEPVALF